MSKTKLDETRNLNPDETKRAFKDKFKLEEEEIDGKLILNPTPRTIRELPKKQEDFLRLFPEANFIKLDLLKTWLPYMTITEIANLNFPLDKEVFKKYLRGHWWVYDLNEEDGYALVVREKIRKLKVYLAGSLFNEAEINQRLKEGKILRETFKHKIDLFNPIEQPFNENKQTLPAPKDIFDGDTNAILNCDVFLADITNNDPGVMVELGIAYANKKQIIAVNSDLRLKSANKYDIPSYSMNHYVLGCLDNRRSVLVYSFDEAIEELKRLL